MEESYIWRYMSLTKYVDLLRSRALFCPKASQFQDETEGKWIAHSVLWGNKQHWSEAKRNGERLQKIIEAHAGDQDGILCEASNVYASLTATEQKSCLGDVLKGVSQAYPHKREEYLQSFVTSWFKHHDNYNEDVQKWTQEINVARESTYISCWNHASSMSLAMWSLYGGGIESVAIRSTTSKLKSLLTENLNLLQKKGFNGEVIDVEYIEGLKEPDGDLQEKLIKRLSIGKDTNVGTFSIKPSMYAYENEVRLIIYPVRNIFEPSTDPHPALSGLSLSIDQSKPNEAAPLGSFIESVHVHPMLDADSMMVRVVKDLNERFGLAEVPIITDKAEAIGASMALQPTGYTSR